MNYKRWIVLLSIVAVAAWFILDAIETNRLDNQARQIQEAPSVDVPKDQPVAAANSGPTPPPRDLVVAKIESENIWFVGKYENGAGVEIPFRPGHAPHVTGNLTPKHENPGFVGPQACKECHLSQYESSLSTAHFKTSRHVDATSIDGNFQPGSNVFRSSDPNLRFEMVKLGERYLQRVHFFDWSFEVPMEIIVGSSKMAQTYLYWHEDGLYQANVTHITDGDQWINSPGYIDGDAAYARPAPERCLDCHFTYFDYREPPNHYTPNSLIMGVTCERCHGPGAEHVAYHKSHPEIEDAHAIANPARLDRQVQMEVCGQCHSGSRALKAPALGFRPGDHLVDFYHPPNDEIDAKNSVHTSNQLTRLSESRCFKDSEMTCVDCHDPHANERGNTKLFSDRCMKCHQNESDCGFHPQDGIVFSDNCIDCHMPRRPTKDLRLQSVQGDVFPPLRDHLIQVDRRATEDYLRLKE
ncbi:MAG: hypothetical protein KDB00_00605 [Planctomycetales bacterium]|nr:hypothetical protein [Planctomycetales bacterium]